MTPTKPLSTLSLPASAWIISTGTSRRPHRNLPSADPAFQDLRVGREISEHPPIGSLQNLRLAAAFVHHAPRPRAGGMQHPETVLPDDQKADVGVQPDQIDAGSGLFQLRREL